MALPNFVYIGPDKAGSTWIFDVMSWHPEVYMASAKDICFFDLHFDKGPKWYERHFKEATDERILGEVSHNYLFSEAAAQRMKTTLPEEVVLMVCLREPAQRAFSAYLYLLKHGLFAGSFEAALKDVPELIDHGRYATHLKKYLHRYQRENLYITCFNDLRADPDVFSRNMFARLGITEFQIPSTLRKKSLPASKSRSVIVSRILKQGAIWARKLGFVRLIGAVKHSDLIKRLLYKPYKPEEKPQPNSNTLRKLKRHFYKEVMELDRMLGSEFLKRWGYTNLDS